MSDLLTAYAVRLTDLDPLLGVSTDPPEGEPIAAGAARGWTRVVDLDPADELAVWGKLRTYVLEPRWAGDPHELDTLLSAWVSWLTAHGARDAGPELRACCGEGRDRGGRHGARGGHEPREGAG